MRRAMNSRRTSEHVRYAIILLAALLALALAAFAVWHLPGFVRALRAIEAIDPIPAGAASAPAVLLVRLSDGDEPSPMRVDTFFPAHLSSRAMQERLPLILYMPGWGSRARDSDVLLRRLAAAGYIVVAIDDVAHDRPSASESERDRKARTAEFDLSSAEGIDGFVATADRKADLAIVKLSRVLDAIVGSGRPLTSVAGALAQADPARVAAMGFSFGGTVAAGMLVRDRRVRAAINLDGWIYGAAANADVEKPYLVFSSTNSLPFAKLGSAHRNAFAMDALSTERQQRLLNRPTSSLVVLQGTLHGDYSDALHGAGRWSQWRPWHPPLADPKLVRETVDRSVLDFLAKHVKAVGTTEGAGASSTGRNAP